MPQPDESVLNYVIKHDALAEVQQAGISADDFIDEFRTVWRYLLRAKQDHGAVPSRAVVRARFPDMVFPRVEQRDLPVLLAQLKQRRKHNDLMKVLTTAASHLTSFESVDGVISVLLGELNSLSLRTDHPESHLVNLFDPATSLRMVEEIKRRRDPDVNGIKTNLKSFDQMCGGLQPQKMVVIIGRPGRGKASAVSEPVLTPDGWVPMGSIGTGDEVVVPSGGTARVASIHPQGVVPIYRVTMSDRSFTDVTADHTWFTTLNHGRKPGVRTTEDIAKTIHLKHYLPLVKPAEYPDHDQPLDPYVLGALLGDGHFSQRRGVSFSCAESELVEHVGSRLVGVELHPWPDGFGHTVRWIGGGSKWDGPNPLVKAIRSLGLEGTTSHTKFIPDSYLWASAQVRLEVLRGLLDTDGYASQNAAEYASKSELLASGVQHLVESLGGTARMTRKPCAPYEDGWVVRVRLPREVNPFRLSRKAQLWDQGSSLRPYRRIVSVEYIRDEAAQCIVVDHPDHLYVTRRHVVTHNSWLDLLFVAHAVMQGKSVILYPLEMTLFDTAMRLYTIFTQKMFGASSVLRNDDLMAGNISTRRVAKFLALLEDRLPGRLHVADVSALSDPYTKDRIAAEVELWRPDMFWVDYLTLLRPPAGYSGDLDWGAVRQLSNGIKNTAMVSNTVGGCSAQVNRAALSSHVFLPRLEHIAYGDSIGQDADQVFSVNRNDKGLFYRLVKNRGGVEIGKRRVTWKPNEGIFEEIPEGEEE